jgi:uncharacterized protein (DUF2141 family)
MMHFFNGIVGMTLLALSHIASAADLQINIVGELDKGEIGCGLFDSSQGFPSLPAPERKQLIPATKSATCTFRDLPPGQYAVAIMNDLNGNGALDKNLLGVPKEPWGVSNNVRPALREPRFDEAKISLEADTTITVRVTK